MTTIYLSSTYEDLKDHRRVVFDALRQGGYQVIAMEDYVATDKRPVDKCLADVVRADIYVGIFAFRYGYIPPPKHNNPEKLSITELELRHAEQLEKPCLTFMVSEDASWPRKFDDARSGKGEQINRLRDYLQTEKTASFFSSPNKLAALVLAAVNKKLQETELSSTKETVASPAITWDIQEKGSPYPGLMHFTRKYAPVFFGRDAEIRDLLDLMYTDEGRFIIVSGSSGTGKSSLVDAGVLPNIEQSGLPNDRSCRSERMLPSRGDHAFDALMRVLNRYVERAGLNHYRLGKELARQPSTFTEQMQTIIAEGIDRDALVLFVDQMEELFTGSSKDKDLAQAESFLSALYRGVKQAPLWVIATIRSDYLHYCHNHPDMLKVLRGSGHYPLGRVETYMMDDMITKPAQAAGLSVSDNLVSRLIQDTGSEPGNLPLLAFVLRRLFEERQGNILSEGAYEAFGGVEGAIAGHVKNVEEKLGSDALNLLPRIFRSLLVVDVEGRPTRRHVPWTEFSKDARPVVESLVKERLLSTDEQEDEKETANRSEAKLITVSVAHEKLFGAWPALADWITENQDDLRILQQAELEAREWKKHEYAKSHLWHAGRLKTLQAIIKRQGDGEIETLVEQYAWPQNRLIKLLENESLDHQERQAIGFYLAELDDLRTGVGLTADGVPDIDWVEVPGSEVELEDGKGIRVVESFKIARYLITNVQFQAFIDAEDRYRNDQWRKGFERNALFEGQQGRWRESNHPRETVSWYEAVAFCRWLSGRLGRDVRLPTEREWQQAATGGDPENVYPWGRDWDATRCNSNQSGLKRTIAVGMYPNGSSLQGVLDMAGNVRERCQNKYDDPDDISIGRSDSRRVLRGGSWISVPQYLRSADRGRSLPDSRSTGVGFRLAQD